MATEGRTDNVSEIFVSYRRADSGGYAGRVFDRLRHEFGDKAVFRDVDTIESGERFPEIIARELEACRVFIPIIGPSWVVATEPGGRRRLDNPEDWVRLEVATALKRTGLCVIPVTVGGAPMPSAKDLPEDLQALGQLQRRDLRDGDTWGADLDLLLQRVARELGSTLRSRRRKALAFAGLFALAGIVVATWNILPRAIRQAKPNLNAEPIVLFDTSNKKDVRQSSDGPPQPAVFSTAKEYYVSHIHTYHWNEGKGSMPGRVSLRRTDGTVYGPWEVTAFAGHNNAPNVNWVARPRIVIPAGTYTVLDLEPETWSYNAESDKRGFAIVKAHPLE